VCDDSVNDDSYDDDSDDDDSDDDDSDNGDAIRENESRKFSKIIYNFVVVFFYPASILNIPSHC